MFEMSRLIKMMNDRKAAPQLVPQLIQNIHNMNLSSTPEESAAKPTAQVPSGNNSSDYKPRYWSPNNSKKEESRSPIVCTHDLIEWSYQIACGMNYLTKRKVSTLSFKLVKIAL
jgi:hypothetical protein